MQHLRKITYSLVATVLLVGCSSTVVTAPVIDTTNLSEVENLSQIEKSAKDQPSLIRLQGLQDTALAAGAQGALAKRSKEIDAMLTAQAGQLDQIFNFTPLMLPHNVLPPVIQTGDRPLHLADSTTIRLADKTYTVYQQARFVTVPPTWHDYLWMSFPKPAEPPANMLPKTVAESIVWRKAAYRGWLQGEAQANTIFSDNVARLKRDFQGMILYRQLLDQNMVSLPFVANTELGVTGNDSQITINDQVLRITALPSLNTNAEVWKPALNSQPAPPPRPVNTGQGMDIK